MALSAAITQKNSNHRDPKAGGFRKDSQWSRPGLSPVKLGDVAVHLGAALFLSPGLFANLSRPINMTKAPSVEPVERSRLLPRVSFRMMILLTTLSAVLFAIARMADNGGEFAASFLMGMEFLLACFVLFAILFLFSWSIAVLRRQCGYVALIAGAVLAVLTTAKIDVWQVTNWYVPTFLVVSGFILLYVPLRESDDLVGSPFAKDQLPPQLLPPREQRS